jgi:hypothetical protein
MTELIAKKGKQCVVHYVHDHILTIVGCALHAIH